jgi:hypothetical protein
VSFCLSVCVCVYVWDSAFLDCTSVVNTLILMLLFPTYLLPVTISISSLLSLSSFLFFLFSVLFQLPSFENFDYFSRRNVDVSRLNFFSHQFSFIANISGTLVVSFTSILTVILTLIFVLISHFDFYFYSHSYSHLFSHFYSHIIIIHSHVQRHIAYVTRG